MLRKLNLAPRSALFFGFFCLMIIAQGLIALKQASILNTAEKFVETNVVPSIALLGQVDKEFTNIRGLNSRLRNPIEPAIRKTQALVDLNKARANILDLLSTLQPLIVTPAGKQFFAELSERYASYQQVQEQYLALIAANSLDDAVKLSSEAMKQSADTVEGSIKQMIELNNNKAKKAGDDATRSYEQSTLIVTAFILIGTLAAIVLALLYTRSVTRPPAQPVARHC